ncbi:high mobility group protein [Aphelenchoides avenae]|nr:high mobility group protein [Aphelenchus avenae]
MLGKRGNLPDPNAPKRPSAAYALWAKENRPHMKAPGMSTSAVNKALGDAWKAMPDKERLPWQRRADQEKCCYVRELAEYKKAQNAQN